MLGKVHSNSAYFAINDSQKKSESRSKEKTSKMNILFSPISLGVQVTMCRQQNLSCGIAPNKTKVIMWIYEKRTNFSRVDVLCLVDMVIIAKMSGDIFLEKRSV